jgi:hypothetical protein
MSSILAGYFRAQAAWRERKIAEYPNDQRNAASAAALQSLADYVEPIDGLLAERGSGELFISAVPELERHLFDMSGSLSLGERAQRAVSRYGYGSPVTDSSHERFVEDLLALSVQDRFNWTVEHPDDPDPTGSLHPFEIAAARDGVYMPEEYWQRRGRATVAERERWVREARGADRESGEGLELPTMPEFEPDDAAYERLGALLVDLVTAGDDKRQAVMKALSPEDRRTLSAMAATTLRDVFGASVDDQEGGE